jgi:HK97 family phage prohead protease
VLIVTAAPPAALAADRARRTITGLVVPWGSYARVSTGQNVAFARGALSLSERAKLVVDHDPAQPVGVYVSATDTDAGLEATFRVPAGARGDQILAEAADGLRDGLSVAADIVDGDENDGGLWVTAAKGRHVALLSEPAFDDARVSAVAAARPTITTTTPGGTTMSFAATPTEPTEPTEPAPDPEPEPTVTAAAALVARPAPARVRDPYPYARPHHMGGPSFVCDAFAASPWGNPSSVEADRWRRAQMMATDPAAVEAAKVWVAGGRPDIAAAPGDTTNQPALTPPRWMPERYVPLVGQKAPLYSVLTKYGTPDFATLEVPRTATETGLSGSGADEITPIAPGTITTTNDTVTIQEVEGSYQISRKLLMGSNPAIDKIVLDALERAWLADVEARAIAFFTLPANSTAWGATYADGNGFHTALRAAMASMAADTRYTATAGIPAPKEYIAAAEADASDGRALLPYPPVINAAGESGTAYTSLSVQGVPLLPGPLMTADHTLLLDQSAASAGCYATPVMNFRFESTTTAGSTTENAKVLQFTKYSGVGFWAQHPGGIILITNSTPIAAGAGNGGGAKAHK